MANLTHTVITTLIAATNDPEVIRFDRRLVILGAIQTFIFVLQLIVFGIQAIQLQRTVKAATEQGQDMKRSIEEAVRSANAMEKSAAAATNASTAVAQSVAYVGHQVRAYISVRINTGAWQDRPNHVRFAVEPIVINTGLTPAYKVRFSAKAGIFEFPLRPDFEFPTLDAPKSAYGILAPQQQSTIYETVREYVSDEEAVEIKRGLGKRVF
ncbi:MAG: hypothetical protein JO170_30955 [Verrucomicrobia bacterium]|nr:hypothetical protein [Verrucomicrobiota bacterium]